MKTRSSLIPVEPMNFTAPTEEYIYQASAKLPFHASSDQTTSVNQETNPEDVFDRNSDTERIKAIQIPP